MRDIQHIFRLAALGFLLSGVATAKPKPKPKPAPKKEQPWVIQVQGKRWVDIQVGEAASFVVIPKKTLEATHRTIGEVLKEVAGLEVKSAGGPGAYSTLSIRGSSPDQVTVFLDGMPLNKALGGGVNLGDFSLANLERIEVYKSQAPARFGDAPIGGVVNLVSKRPKASAGNTATLKTMIGSFGHTRFSLNAQALAPKTRLMAFLEDEKAKGDFSYFDDHGTPFNRLDDATRSRLNNAFENRQWMLSGTRDGAHGRYYAFSAAQLRKHQGIPGFGVAQSLNASLQTEESRLNLDLTQAGSLQKGGDLSLGLRFLDQTSSFRDLFAEIGLGKQDNQNKARTLRLESGMEGRKLGANTLLNAHLFWTSETWKPRDRLSTFTVGRASSKNSIRLAADLKRTLRKTKSGRSLTWTFSPRLLTEHSRLRPDPTNTAAGRTNRSATKNFLNADMALVWQTSPTSDLRLTFGTGSRTPSFFELFGDRGSSIGNANLAPEKNRRLELGLRGALGKVGLDAALFRTSARNLIVYEQTGQFVARPVNLDNTRTTGLETTLWVRPAKRLNTKLTYSRLDARNHALPGAHVPGVALHTLGLENEWQINQRASLAWRVHERGPAPQDSANFTVLAHQRQHDLAVHYLWGKARVDLEVLNLGDTRLEDIRGFPLPGRSWQTGFSFEF